MSSWSKVKISIFNPVEDSPDFEREINLVVNWRPGYPAKINAPMEDCYPAEGPEFEVLQAQYDDGRPVPQRILESLDDAQIMDLVERMIA